MDALSTRLPQFRSYDDVYFADACEPLHDAVRQGRVELHALVHGAYPGVSLPANVVTGIGSVGFWDAPRSHGWGLQWHRNEGIEITYLDRGELQFSTREADWTLQPGQFTITRPWQEHRVGRPDVTASRLSWLIIDVGVRRPHQDWAWPDWVGLANSDCARLTTMLQNNENPVWEPDAGVAAAFEAIRQVVSSPGTPTLESELRLATTQLLLALLLAPDRANSTPTDHDLRSPRRAVRMFLEELDAHLDHQWTLAEMASAARLGRSQFSRYCRELTNRTPLEYLAFRRVTLAMRLLTERLDLTVTDVAMTVGFSSSQYFATVFRRQIGVSASAFRAMNESPSPVSNDPQPYA